MRNSLPHLMLGGLFCGLLTGCGSMLPNHKTLPGPTAVEVYQARREPPAPLEPALSVLPRAPINAPRPATISQAPLPVWNDAQVVKVELDAYVNEKGEAFGPSVKYVVKQPGGWNVDALRNPHRSYVPTENTPPIPSAFGYSANPMVSPGDGARSLGDFRPVQPAVLQDLSRIRITGFVERSQEHMARSMAMPGETPLFDESLGWILVPSAALVPANQLPAGYSPSVIPQATPIPSAMPMYPMPAPQGYYPQPQQQMYAQPRAQAPVQQMTYQPQQAQPQMQPQAQMPAPAPQQVPAPTAAYNPALSAAPLN